MGFLPENPHSTPSRPREDGRIGDILLKNRQIPPRANAREGQFNTSCWCKLEIFPRKPTKKGFFEEGENSELPQKAYKEGFLRRRFAPRRRRGKRDLERVEGNTRRVLERRPSKIE